MEARAAPSPKRRRQCEKHYAPRLVKPQSIVRHCRSRSLAWNACVIIGSLSTFDSKSRQSSRAFGFAPPVGCGTNRAAPAHVSNHPPPYCSSNGQWHGNNRKNPTTQCLRETAFILSRLFATANNDDDDDDYKSDDDEDAEPFSNTASLNAAATEAQPDHHNDDDNDSGSSKNLFVEWTGNDVYDDLDALRREIVMSNADQHLRRMQDREKLDWFAHGGRRPVYRDLRQFVLAPIVLSLFLTALCNKPSCPSILVRLVSHLCNVHFVVFVLLAPIILLWDKQRSKRALSWSLSQPFQESSNHQVLNQEHQRSFGKFDAKDTSCHDHVQCLLENWTSAIAGPTIALAVMYMIQRQSRAAADVSTGVVAAASFASVRLLTRLGVIASLHQYPILLYKLRRRHQPQPLDRHVMRLQQLISLAVLSPWTFVLGMANDLSQVMVQLLPVLVFVPSSQSLQWIVPLIGLGLFSCAKRRLLPMRTRGREQADQHQPLTRRTGRVRSLVGTFLTATQLAVVWRLGCGVLQSWQRWRAMLIPLPVISLPSKRLVAVGACLSVLLLAGPVGHLIAVRKLFRVSYTHDLSLALDDDTFNGLLNNPQERQERFKWRYRLEWREPERIMQTLSKWKGDFSYWLLFQGGVEDQLRKEFRANQRSAAYRRGVTVLQRTEQEMKNNPGAPKPDRSQWKARAMEQIAAKHERDYKSGTYRDPLGVAVQQTFGIGLGYLFDHWSDLKEGERPSAQRLQARASKSAIKRVQEIYDAEAVREALDSIHDPKEKELKKAELRRTSEAEIAYLASALSELIPTDPSRTSMGDEEAKATKIQQLTRKYKRTASHEIVIDDSMSNASPAASPSAQTLFDNSEDKNQTDEEFVDAWMRRLHEEDENESTVLV